MARLLVTCEGFFILLQDELRWYFEPDAGIHTMASIGFSVVFRVVVVTALVVVVLFAVVVSFAVVAMVIVSMSSMDVDSDEEVLEESST